MTRAKLCESEHGLKDLQNALPIGLKSPAIDVASGAAGAQESEGCTIRKPEARLFSVAKTTRRAWRRCTGRHLVRVLLDETHIPNVFKPIFALARLPHGARRK